MRGQGLDAGFFEQQRVQDYPPATQAPAPAETGEARFYEPVLSEWFNYSDLKSFAATLRQRES
jgi:hypothetical protein